MRTVGIVLVLVGALALGYGDFAYASRPEAPDGGAVWTAPEREKRSWFPQTLAGIAVVSGLLLLAAGNRRE
jgi:hypothetical protein